MLWENKNFLKISDKVLQKLDLMNPDSLNKILQSLSMLKKHKPASKEIYTRIIDLVKTPYYFFVKNPFFSAFTRQ